jgi:predicted  nucleic acid-binding Zn-ribbon protein
MIDEIFLVSAVKIRKKYINAISEMDKYQKRASQIVSELELYIKQLEDLKKSYTIEKKSSDKDAINTILSVIRGVEEESLKLEKILHPMNAEIENLSKEENELYRQIKERHSNLSDDQIIISIQERLKIEGIV